MGSFCEDQNDCEISTSHILGGAATAALFGFEVEFVKFLGVLARFEISVRLFIWALAVEAEPENGLILRSFASPRTLATPSNQGKQKYTRWITDWLAVVRYVSDGRITFWTLKMVKC